MAFWKKSHTKSKDALPLPDEDDSANPPSSQVAGNSSLSLGIVKVTIHGGTGFNGDVSRSPFCVVELDQQEVATSPARDPLNPSWEEEFKFDVTSNTVEINVWVYSSETSKESSSTSGPNPPSTSSQALNLCLGRMTLSFKSEGKRETDAWYPLARNLDTDPAPSGKIHVVIEFTPSQISQSRLSMDDFTLMRVIGKGSFGKVMVVKKNDTKRLYAIKVLKKQQLSERGEVAHTLAERKILQNNTNPFLVSLKFSFQTPEKIYLVLDYIAGGELFVHLQKEGVFSEERARLYTAQLVCAIEHLHANKIIYRDLKPENILIDMNGYVKLTDFGLAKENVQKDGKTATFCGTPEYMAPEVLLQQGYGQEVDWWTIGTLLYEMLMGLPPFYDENVQIMYQKILHQPLSFPPHCSTKARSIITGFLQRNPTKRLGKQGVDEIKSHLFFEGLSWTDLMARKIKVPWKPAVSHALDTSNFDPAFTHMKPVDSVASPTFLGQSVQEKFIGFTYCGDDTVLGSSKN